MESMSFDDAVLVHNRPALVCRSLSTCAAREPCGHVERAHRLHFQSFGQTGKFSATEFNAACSSLLGATGCHNLLFCKSIDPKRPCAPERNAEPAASRRGPAAARTLRARSVAFRKPTVAPPGTGGDSPLAPAPEAARANQQ